MKNKKELKSLDDLIVKGQIIDAFEKYFADNVTTRSENGELTTSKAQKKEWLTSFFGEMSSTDEIILHDHFLHDDASYSKFTFVFTSKAGEKLKWHEIITRKWKDGKVTDEFYSNGSLDDLKDKIKKEEKDKSKKDKKGKKDKTEKDKKADKKGDKKESKKHEKHAEKKSDQGEPAKVKKPVVEVEVEKAPVAPVQAKQAVLPKGAQVKKDPVKKPVVKKEDDLKIIEGIGPKVEEVLKAYKITTYAALAKSDPLLLKEILTNASSRYKMFDPSSWPKQAQLAADGKTEELELLKESLKGGK